MVTQPDFLKALNDLYTENYLKKEDKERITEIVEEAKDAYHGILEDAEKFSKPVDKDLWSVTPQTFNCNYDPHTNCMYILGAYARGDIYNSEMSDEACADMAGMKVMLKIAEKKKDFDYDKFFRAYANLWLTKGNLQMARAYLEDVHPMNYLRINCTLQQYDEFLDQYGITEGDTMYLAPEDRVNIW